MTGFTPGERMPDGRRCSAYFSSPMTTVWPALLPPLNLTTQSVRSPSRSVAFPLPSSPHWTPTITIPGMGHSPGGGRRYTPSYRAGHPRTSASRGPRLPHGRAVPASHRGKLDRRPVSAVRGTRCAPGTKTVSPGSGSLYAGAPTFGRRATAPTTPDRGGDDKAPRKVVSCIGYGSGSRRRSPPSRGSSPGSSSMWIARHARGRIWGPCSRTTSVSSRSSRRS